jgi:hypothetical protein
MAGVVGPAGEPFRNNDHDAFVFKKRHLHTFNRHYYNTDDLMHRQFQHLGREQYYAQLQDFLFTALPDVQAY